MRILRAFHEDEGGQALILLALFLVGLIAVAGLVADGGLVLAQRRDLQNAADAAAAAGAMQIDEAAYRASGGALIVLDPDAAQQAAIAYLVRENGTEYAVETTDESVAVAVTRIAPTAFLRVLGIDGVEVGARAVAEPRIGIAGGP